MTKPESKSYKVDFYVVTFKNNRKHTVFAELLASAEEAGYSEAIPLDPKDEEKFQIRSLVSLNRGKVLQGVFGRCKFGEKPVQGNAKGEEADVELKPGHGLVEKNHFLFFATRNLLVYQRNTTGSHIAKFQRFATLAAGAGIAFEPILTTDAYQRLIDGGDVKYVDISFQQPADPSLYTDLFASDAMKLVKSVGGLNARMRISVGRNPRHLLARVKEAAVVLAKGGLAKVARIKLDEEDDPIDLVADRVIESISVPLAMNGRPRSEDIYAALQSAETKRADDLKTFFGK